MQRNFLDQNPLGALALLALFVVYESLSSIYLLMPPLLGLLLVHFMRSFEKQHLPSLFLVSIMLLFFEVEKGYLFASTLFYFAFLYHSIIPRLKHYIHCDNCLKFIYIVLAYIGFWLFSLLISKMLAIPSPDIDWYILYYIVIEFILVILL